MKMSKPGLCCDSCFGQIARRSTVAARLWMDLCEIQLNSSLFGLRTPDFPALQLLEILGFIITTDVHDIIIVKVLGKHRDDIGTYYCGGNCE